MHWDDSDRKTLCPFCGMGCSLEIRPPVHSAFHGERGMPLLGFDYDGAVNRGSLCARGNLVLELLRHPRRLEAPLLREDGKLRPTTWDAALDALVLGIRRVREEHGPGAFAILAGPTLTDEEAALAVRLARHLGGGNLDCCSPEDRPVFAGPAAAGAAPRPIRTVDEIETMTAILVVGDLFTLAPCISKPVLTSRYARRQNVLGVLDSVRNRTGWFGKPALFCAPGRETMALAHLLRIALMRAEASDLPWRDAAMVATENPALAGAGGLDEAAAARLVTALIQTPESGVLFTADFAGRERDVLAAGLAALLAEATGSGFLAMPVGANAVGVRKILGEGGFPEPAGLTAAEIVEAATTSEVKAMLVLGLDPLAGLPGGIAARAAQDLELLAVTSPMPGETTAAADLVLPSKVWGEKSGSVRNAFGDVVRIEPVMEGPGAAKSDGEILTDLLSRFDAPSGDEPVPADAGEPVADTESIFFQELALHFRLAHRRERTKAAGTHLLLPRSLPPHVGDGWITRLLSWPRHEFPEAQLSVSLGHASELGVAEGDRVRVRSREGAVDLRVRIEGQLREGVVLAPPCYPEVRRLVSWRLDPVLGGLDLRPARVSVEPLPEDGDG